VHVVPHVVTSEERPSGLARFRPWGRRVRTYLRVYWTAIGPRVCARKPVDGRR